MASISSLGVGSNLELNTLLSNIETAEKAPLNAITKQAESYQSKLSAFASIKSVLASYQTAAQKLADAKTFAVVKATSTKPEVLTVSSSSTSVPGSYKVNVTNLAAAHSIVTKPTAKVTDAIGTGTITFDFGGDIATGGAGKTTKTVTIGEDDKSLAGIRDAINRADVGVTASIINDGGDTPYRLVLTSNKSGTDSAMRINASSPELKGLVAFDPKDAVQANGSREAVKAENATLTINGIDVVSQSNLVVDAAQGITMNLVAKGESSVSVVRDTDAIKTAINAFVTAYNNIQSSAKELTAFDTTSGSKSALNGDGTLRSIQTQLRSMLSVPQANGKGGTITLADIGITFDSKDGTMKVDAEKLDKSVSENLAGITAMFSSTADKGGIGKQVNEAVKTFNSTNGMLTLATDGITRTLKDLEDRYDAVEARVKSTMDRYRAQFTALDVLVNQMNGTRTYLTQQFNALNNSTGK
ncbi:flagellar hook protein [Cupriavidus sp. SK-4]|uniref:flagellar filament capping protein FliD n=1 Tax=Cupriavidus sp. SK-4 TaxID=574750 RepID=UPI0004486568|nr:flagellar filament capping protein FliD [Cupriavidus sp. SK-4]EYS87762.1 flagellar hook protein [Cupriavidus sp. SK-4]